MVIVKDCVVCGLAPQNCSCGAPETVQEEVAVVEEVVKEVKKPKKKTTPKKKTAKKA